MNDIKERVDRAIKRIEDLSPEEFRQEFIAANGGVSIICKNTGVQHAYSDPRRNTIVSCKTCGVLKPR